MSVIFKKRLPAAVSTPGAGMAALFVDSADFRAKVRDESGTLYGPNYGLASLAAAKTGLANTEAQVIGVTLPAGSLQVGSTFRIIAKGVGTTSTTPGNTTFRIRLGPTTLTGNIPASVVAAATASLTAQPWMFEALVTIRSISASGTAIGECSVSANSASGLYPAQTFSAVTATVAVDTTVANILELTHQSGAATSSVTVHVAVIEAVQL